MAKKPGDTFREANYTPEMVVIPPGEFMMGAPMNDEESERFESPQHRVEIAYPIALGKYAVTFEEFNHFVLVSGYRHEPEDNGWGRGKRPVVNVSWEDAQAYVEWLSAETGGKYRLPSESEWEYACRSGTTTSFYFGEEIQWDQANYASISADGSVGRGEYRKKTITVGTFPANGFGLHEMHGNVSEWVADCWNESYEGAPQDGSTWLSGDCSFRVLRGGSWFFRPWGLRSSVRLRYNADFRSHFFGFRVAQTLDT